MTNIWLRLLVVSFVITATYAHSWMQCADYTDENGRLWDEKKCRGWPRDFVTKFSSTKTFGADVGFDYRPSDTAACQTTLTGGSYSTDYPAAQYSPGQRVCMAWPPKNHVAANCNNPNIIDSGTKIYRSGLNPTSDPTLTEFTQNLVADLGTNTGTKGIGYQNCPTFCDNADKALCTGCFDIPADLTEGKYIFLWDWAFNSPADKYTTCWDVTISKSVKNAAPALYSKMTPDEYKASPGQTTLVSSSGPAPDDSTTGQDQSGSEQARPSGSGNSGAYSSGSLAAAIILTLIAVTAIFVGLLYFARAKPNSEVGSFVHRFLQPSAGPRREALLHD